MTNCLYCNKPLTKDTHFGLHAQCFKKAFNVDQLYRFESFSRKESLSTSQPGQNAEKPYLSSYFAGNYRKYEALLNTQKYIFKLGNAETPEIAPVENYCNWVGLNLGITIPRPFALIKGNKELAFVAKNFMATLPGHHNLVHLYHYLSPGEENYTVEKIAEAIARETQSAQDVDLFFMVILFDALIGNHDRHGRNLALIEIGSKKRLSPIYDNNSALGLEKEEFLLADWNPTGKIATKETATPGMKDYVQELIRLNQSAIISKFLSVLKKIPDATKAPGLSKNMATALKQLLAKRQKEIEDTYVH